MNKSYDAYSKAYANLIKSLRNPYGDMEDLKQGVLNFWETGRAWADEVLKTKVIPSGKEPMVDKGSRAFYKSRMKLDWNIINKWVKANDGAFQVLLNAESWPDKSEGKALIKVGPFILNDTTGKGLEVWQKALATAITLIQKIKLPGAQNILYGDMLVTGNIRGGNWAAAYSAPDDIIYLNANAILSFGEKITGIIHELCHRYWDKVLGSDKKKAWTSYHRNLGKVDMSSIEVGYVLPFLVDGKQARVKRLITFLGKPSALLQNVQTGEVMFDMSITSIQARLKDMAAEEKFPSTYAAKNPEEHFCEAASLRAVNRLKPANKEAFDRIILGNKIANSREFPPDIRQSAFDRCGGKCERCGKKLTFSGHSNVGHWHAHHKVRSKGHILSNCEVLCTECHKKTKTYVRHIDAATAVASTHMTRLAESAATALMRFIADVAKDIGMAEHSYVVGGAVRDKALGQPVKDVDVVVETKDGRNALTLGKEIAERLGEPSPVSDLYGVVHVGPVHNTFVYRGVDLKGQKIEIVTARKEKYDKTRERDYHKPSEVAPGTIMDDVLRRDFTMNSLIWNLLDVAQAGDKAQIIDLTGKGLNDLREGIIRTPLDPDETFSDDPTRMLRAIRFAVKYGFNIPPDVKAAIKRNAPLIARVPWQPAADVLFDKILTLPKAPIALKLLKGSGLLDHLLPRIPLGYYKTKLRGNAVKGFQLLLALEGLGFLGTPFAGLPVEGKRAVRNALRRGMPVAEAEAWAERMLKPPIDMQALIAEFGLKSQQDFNQVKSMAFQAVLANPDANQRSVMDAVRSALAAR